MERVPGQGALLSRGFVRVASAAALTCGLLLSAGGGTALAGGSDRFSPRELERLQRGDLVERRLSEERGELRLFGGSSFQVIDAPPSIVWQALLDTSHYPRMVPQLSEAKLVEQGLRRRKVYMRHHSGPVDSSYYLDMVVDAARREIRFHMDDSRPSSIRAAYGLYAARPYGEGRTLLAYAVMADIGEGLTTLVMRPTIHEWMMKVPWMVKRFVEGSGRELYRLPPPEPPEDLAASEHPGAG